MGDGPRVGKDVDCDVLSAVGTKLAASVEVPSSERSIECAVLAGGQALTRLARCRPVGASARQVDGLTGMTDAMSSGLGCGQRVLKGAGLRSGPRLPTHHQIVLLLAGGDDLEVIPQSYLPVRAQLRGVV